MPVPDWVQQITEDVVGGPPFAVGDRVEHPDGYQAEIIGGCYWAEGGLSNHWTWQKVLPDGSLSPEKFSGYGWRPAQP